MGTDLNAWGQKRIDGKWVDVVHVFDWRQYGMYGFLADVRNYSQVPPLSEPRGLAEGEPEPNPDDHDTYSWLMIDELLNFNYDAMFEDRRCTVELSPGYFNGAQICEPGQGKIKTFREFLGPCFFKDLQRLKDCGAERVVLEFVH